MFRCLSRFASVSKKEEYARYFLLSYSYPQEAYYLAYPTKKQRMNYVRKFEQERHVYLLGGSRFPMEGAYYLFNCDDESTPQEFMKGDPHVKSGLVLGHSLAEVSRMSREKMGQLAKFYEII